MAALWNRASHYGFALRFHISSFFFFFFPRLISAVAVDVYHTSVALVRIYDAGLKCAARGKLEIQDAKMTQKIAISAPSHNFVVLYLRN